MVLPKSALMPELSHWVVLKRLQVLANDPHDRREHPGLVLSVLTIDVTPLPFERIHA